MNTNHELKILCRVLSRLKMDDVVVEYDNRGLVATDSWKNTWRNEDFYRFLIDEAFVFTGESEVLGISPELYKEFMELANKRIKEG